MKPFPEALATEGRGDMANGLAFLRVSSCPSVTSSFITHDRRHTGNKGILPNNYLGSLLFFNEFESELGSLALYSA